MQKEEEEGNKMPKRGCGSSRDKESLYYEMPRDLIGFPIEFFITDPVPEWKGKHLRGPMPYTVEYPETNEEITHLILGIGSSTDTSYYPSAPSYIEECRRYGVSKKIPIKSIPWEDLEPGKSLLWLIHDRAIPDFEYRAEYDCPLDILERKKENVGAFAPPEVRRKYDVKITWIKSQIEQKIEYAKKKREEEHECIGALWPLAYLINSEKHQVYKHPSHIPNCVRKECTITPSSIEDEDRVMIALWSDESVAFTFTVKKPLNWRRPIEWKPGVILKLPIETFAYVTDEGRVPEWLREEMHANEKDFEIYATED